MSCVESESVEIEKSERERKGDASVSRPFIIPGARVRPSDWVARRVAEILDFELAQGSMPA